MSSVTLSDLSRMFQLRHDTVRTRQNLDRAAQELSSGRTANLSKAVSGNFGPLVAIDERLSAVSAHGTNQRETAMFIGTAQLAITNMRQVGENMGLRLVAATPEEFSTAVNIYAGEGQSAFEVTVSALNQASGGRSLFAGAATDGPALASAQDMLTELRTLVAGETTAAGVVAAVDTWFGAGGGFETMGYLGSASDLTSFEIGEGRMVQMSLRADDDVMREQLKGLALVALLDDTGIAGYQEKARLGEAAGFVLANNEAALIKEQALLGLAEERIETTRVHNATERTALEMARSEIVTIDPYDVATELQQLEIQLQTIYSLTARLSGLSLTNYLR